MLVIIDISSKNLKSLNFFTTFLVNKNVTSKLKINFFQSHSFKPVKKKVITVLQSPHVNKTAQEHFEHRLYKNSIRFFTPNLLLSLIFFKKLKYSFFSDLNFNIKIFFNYKLIKNKIKYNFNLDNYKLIEDDENFLITPLYFNKNLKKYLQILETYGEIAVNK